MQPASYRGQDLIPLWAGNKQSLKNEDVPKCERCKGDRQFEIQIMPQIFDKIEELRLVDWETLVVYTCNNPACLPNFKEEQFFQEEFGFVQFSTDF